MALLARNVQGRAAAVLGLVDRRASLDKQPGDLEVTILARDEQRREAVSVCLVTAAPAAIIRRTQSIWPAMLASRRGAVILGLVYRRVSLEKQLDDLQLALLAVARLAQRRGAADGSLVDRSASSKKQPDALEAAVLARNEQRCEAAAHGLVVLTAALAPRSSRAHPGWPFWHAMDSGVAPLTSTWLIAALASRTRGGRAASPGCPGTAQPQVGGHVRADRWPAAHAKKKTFAQVEEFYNEGHPAE